MTVIRRPLSALKNTVTAILLLYLVPNCQSFAVPYQIQQQQQQQHRSNFHLQQRPGSTNPLAFLPGLGTIGNINGGGLQSGVRHPRSQLNNGQTPNNLGDNPFLAPSSSSNPTFSNANGEKCTYTQMKGGPIAGANCHKGGMACEKQCGYDDGNDGLNCR